jgi:hypothetical protein
METSDVSSESECFENEVSEVISMSEEEERASKRRKTGEGYESTFKDPSREEMTLYKETENLFKSSLFSLQVLNFSLIVLTLPAHRVTEGSPAGLLQDLIH